MVEIALQSTSEQLMYKYTMTINTLVLARAPSSKNIAVLQNYSCRKGFYSSVCMWTRQSELQNHTFIWLPRHAYQTASAYFNAYLYCMLAHILILRHGLSDALHDKSHKWTP